MKKSRGQKAGAVSVNTSRKRVFAIGAIIMGVVLIPIGAALFFNGGLGMSESARFTKYLNEKYGQEFVVENVTVVGEGLGVQGTWKADAYPKSDSSLRFDIRRDQSTGDISVDTFLTVLWTKQGAGEVKDFLAREIPENDGYILRIEPGKKLYESIQGYVPSLATALEGDKSLIVYSLSVRNATDVSSSEPSGARLEDALKVVNFVKAKNITPASFVYYNYRDVSFNDRDNAGQQKYQYGVHLERDELKDVNTAADLEKYFQVLGQ